MKLQNRSAAVTDASTPAGEAVARLFVQEGASVAAICSDTGKLEQLKESLAGMPGKIEIVSAETCLRENISAAGCASKLFGSADLLVCIPDSEDTRAGIADVSDEDFAASMNACLKKPMAEMRSAVNYFLKNRKRGIIINILSSRQDEGVSRRTANEALTALTRNTAFMYMKKNIRCNLIEQAPGKEQDTAQAALFLAGDSASYIDGTIFPAGNVRALQRR